MGKIRSKRQEPAKTAKKQIVENKKQLQHLNSLIKVLRPKVYITETSGFKQLVQELTGNTNTCLSPEITAGQDSPVMVFDDQGSPDEQSVGKESSSSADSLSPGLDDPDDQQHLNLNYVGVDDMKYMVANNYGDGLLLGEDDQFYQDRAEGSWVFESDRYYGNYPSNYYDQQEVSLFEFNHDQFPAAEIISSDDVFL